MSAQRDKGSTNQKKVHLQTAMEIDADLRKTIKQIRMSLWGKDTPKMNELPLHTDTKMKTIFNKYKVLESFPIDYRSVLELVFYGESMSDNPLYGIEHVSQNQLTITVSTDIQKRHWDFIWQNYINRQQKKTKNKSRKDAELIYALLKAKKSGKNSTQISKLLEKGDLPHYGKALDIQYDRINLMINRAEKSLSLK